MRTASLDDDRRLLGVPEDAGRDELRRAYHRLAFLHHPDRGGDAVRLAAVQAAYERLLAAWWQGRNVA